MYRVNVQEAEMEAVYAGGAQGVGIQWLIDESRGAPNFAMRRFVLEPGGSTPFHQHPWEHEVYILGGAGVVVTDQGEEPLSPQTAVFVAPDESHQFRAAADSPLEFLCMVPNGPATVH